MKEGKQQPILLQFDTFHDRVDRAFKSMIPSSSVAIRDEDDGNARAGEGAACWRTSSTLAIRLGNKFDEEEEEEEEEEENKDDDDDDEREGRESDCLFGTKKETRNSIGKCDRLTNEEEFDGDDLIAVGTTDFVGVGLQLTVGEPKKKKSRGGGATVPDHEKFPLKYTKYSFDEPVYVSGGGGIGGRGGDWGSSREGRKGDGEEEERRERKKETKGATDDEEKTAPKVEEPRIMRGKKRNDAAHVAESGDKKRTRRVTRSSTMATRSIAAQNAENGE